MFEPAPTARQASDAVALKNLRHFDRDTGDSDVFAAESVLARFVDAGMPLDDIVSLPEIRTVGDLRAAIAHTPDDTPVVLGATTLTSEGDEWGAIGSTTHADIYEAFWRVLQEDGDGSSGLYLTGVWNDSDVPRLRSV